MKNIYILLAVAVIILIAGWLIFSNLNQPVEETENVEIEIQQPEEKVILVVNYGQDELEEIEIEFEQGMTVFEVLEKSSLTLKTKQYDIGVLIEAIGDRENSQDNKYWLYYVNDEMPMVSVDKKEVKPGDKIEFRFEESTF